MQDDPLRGREIIYEYFPYGQYVRVSAMDAKTLTEVRVLCSRYSTETVMQNNARRRLAYVLRKKGYIS